MKTTFILVSLILALSFFSGFIFFQFIKTKKELKDAKKEKEKIIENRKAIEIDKSKINTSDINTNFNNAVDLLFKYSKGK